MNGMTNKTSWKTELMKSHRLKGGGKQGENPDG